MIIKKICLVLSGIAIITSVGVLASCLGSKSEKVDIESNINESENLVYSARPVNSLELTNNSHLKKYFPALTLGQDEKSAKKARDAKAFWNNFRRNGNRSRIEGSFIV